MCVETNENVKKVNMQETVRLDFIGELKKETETNILQMQNSEQNEENNNSNSEISAEFIQQPEKTSTSGEIMSKNEISNKNIPDNQNELIEQNNEEEKKEEIETIETIENNQNQSQQASDVSDIIEENKVEENKIEECSTQEPQAEIKNSEEDIAKSKEKQHVQDKKDYRLERMLFDRINKMQGKIKESLELIKKFERINAKEENLPNIVTTLHDKLTQEVIKQFRTVGIEFNMKSYLVQAIVSDLLCKFEEGVTEFKDCSENLNFVREVQEDFESRVEIAPTSKVKNLFARIRGLFKPERKQERLEQLERERQEKKLEEANIHLIKYKFINSELEKYTIKNNIVNSLSKEILHGQGSGLTLSLSDFIDKKIASEMKKLGLDNLIPELNQKIYNEYKEKDENITQEEYNQMSVGEIKRNMKLQKAEIVRNKITRVVNLNNKSQEEDEGVAV